MQATLDNFTGMEEIQQGFNDSMSWIREELDQHLDSINQNSVEIQSNYDFLESINTKVDKLEERLDELTLIMKEGLRIREEEKQFSTRLALSSAEKEIFLALYTSHEPLSYEEIALRTSRRAFEVEELMTSLKIKGIPVVKKSFAGKVLLILDEEFKEEQAKYNIVNIRHNILTQFN